MSTNKEKSVIKSIAQARAKYAWDCAKNNSNDSEYASLVRRIPMYIKVNGLLNTLAFLYSKSEREKKALKDIMNWLTHQEWGLTDKKNIVRAEKETEEAAFIKYLTQTETRDIMQFTLETIGLFTWLRRFVKTEE
jgi:CRISPR-associated protein Cmr5